MHTLPVVNGAAVMFLVAALACQNAVATEIVNETQKLLPSDGAPVERFGASVWVSGDVAVIGAPLDDDNGDKSGSAYIYRYKGTAWVEEQKLLASDGAEDDWFGTSVSVNGDVAVIGAHHGNENESGSAYVYRYNGTAWVEEQKLVPSDGALGDLFGQSVSVSGDVAVIGAFLDDDNGFNSGSAYVYRYNGIMWIEEQKLLASDGAPTDFFGGSVSVSANVAVIGAQLDDTKDNDTGSAYVYRYNGTTWTEEQKLLASDGASVDKFGKAVCVSGDVAVIGAESDDDNGVNSGSAYVYRYNGTTWTEEQKLLASDGAAGDMFGYVVAVIADVAVVGALNDDDNGMSSGSAYVYRYNGTTWTEEQKLLPSDGAADDWFGYAVSVSGDTALIGACADDDNGDGSGSAYVFELTGVCLTDLNDDGDTGPADLAALLDAWGPNPGHPSDFNDDGEIGPADLAFLLDNWGRCL